MRASPPLRIGSILVVLFVVSLVLGYGSGRWVDASGPAGGSAAAIPAGSATPSSTVEVPEPTAPLGSSEESTTTARPSTTTTAPPSVLGRPLRVAMAGDSVMAGLDPAVRWALQGSGAAEVRFVLTPSLLRDPTVRFTWTQQLDSFDPDVVVMFVGTWETGQVLDPDSYPEEVLDPWVELLVSRGAEVVWIGNPLVGGDEANERFATLNGLLAELPDRWPQVTYLPAGLALDSPDGTFQPTLELDDGTVVRTRQLDGLHLCPDGAGLLADLVLGELGGRWQVEPVPGWRDGGWRDEAVYPADQCPVP